VASVRARSLLEQPFRVRSKSRRRGRADGRRTAPPSAAAPHATADTAQCATVGPVPHVVVVVVAARLTVASVAVYTVAHVLLRPIISACKISSRIIINNNINFIWNSNDTVSPSRLRQQPSSTGSGKAFVPISSVSPPRRSYRNRRSFGRRFPAITVTSARHARPRTTVAAFMRLCFGQWCIPWPGRNRTTTITGVPTTDALPLPEDYDYDNDSVSSAVDVLSAAEEPMTRALQPSDASSSAGSIMFDNNTDSKMIIVHIWYIIHNIIYLCFYRLRSQKNRIKETTGCIGNN